MRYFFIAYTLIFLLVLESRSQSDSLVINLKNGQVEKVAISQISTILFENVTTVEELISNSKGLIIKGNYPNPFTEQTSIEFEIASAGNIEISIYDNSGKLIRTLKCENCHSGKNNLQWNSLDNNNNKVQNGVYYYEVRFGNAIQLVKKMIIAR